MSKSKLLPKEPLGFDEYIDLYVPWLVVPGEWPGRGALFLSAQSSHS